MTLQYDFGSKDGPNYETHNPARPSRQIGRYAILDDDAIERTIARANAIAKEWARVPGLERGQRLDAFLDKVVSEVDRIAEAITLEQGKTLSEAKAEVLKGCAEGRFMVGEAARAGATPTGTGRADFSNLILRRPRGVIFCVSPWNFPAMTPLRKMCPAIAFGNAVVMKPSQFTPAAAYILEEIAGEFFPKDLFRIAMISGRQASSVIANGDIHGVSFTGSVEVGKLVYSAAAQNLVPVQLELGGKNAAIVSDTDDLKAAATQITNAAFQTSGQRCTAISRVLVQRDLLAEMSDLLAENAGAIVLGDGMKPETQMGPLCNFPHWQGVQQNTARAVEEGAVPLVGGNAPASVGQDGGYFFEPTVLGNVDHNSTASQNEIFGPVLSVLEFDDFDQALAMLNGTEFGLTSALFSNNHRYIQKFLQESQNGMLHVNHGTIPDNNMPFGGIKNSGVGAYSVGPTAVNFYTSEHAAYLSW